MRYLTVLALATMAFAQESGWRKVDEGGKLDQGQLTESQISDIITKFAAKESAFAKARENYTYRQTARLQELEDGGAVVGRWEMITDVIFTPGERRRTEKVVRAPVPTLKRIQLTPEDEQDLRNVQPFVLTSEEIPKYNVRYLGKQMADEIPCYVFAVKPKKMEKGQRYFQGLVWVDDHDLQIVKSYGRGVGIVRSDNQFPKFETYREQIDGKYWFPTYTRADDVLNFEGGGQRIRMTVKYEDYKLFGGDISIQYGDEATPEPKPAEPKPVEPKKP